MPDYFKDPPDGKTIDLKNIRTHYDEEFMHIVDSHQQEIMEIYKKRYSDDTFDDIESFLRGIINGTELNKRLESYIIAATELVYENHDDTKVGCTGHEGDR